MKEKGFTLIELLAVIVILAIIALIAVPIILNIINSTKTSANERSKELYLDAVEQAIARKNLTGEYNPINCEVIENGNLKCEGYEEPLTVEVNGTKPNKGSKITFENGKVIKSKLVFGDNSSEEESKDTYAYIWYTGEEVNGPSIGENASNLETSLPADKNYYLKYKLDDTKKVTESYACTVYNNKETCLRGGSSDYYGYAENESEYTGNVLILKGLEGEGLSCTFSESHSDCDDGAVYLNAYSDGYVGAFAYDGNCNVYGDGSSACLG